MKVDPPRYSEMIITSFLLGCVPIESGFLLEWYSKIVSPVWDSMNLFEMYKRTRIIAESREKANILRFAVNLFKGSIVRETGLNEF